MSNRGDRSVEDLRLRLLALEEEVYPDRIQTPDILSGTGGDSPVEDDGSNNIVPKSGQTFGDGTTSANHKTGKYESLSTATKPVIDVTHPDYGAVGDGVTNDTSTIQNVIDNAPVGATIWLPDGDYLVYDLNITTNDLTLDGPGILLAFGSGGRTVSVEADRYTHKVDIDCQQNTDSGVFVTGYDDTTVENCSIENTNEGSGVEVSAGSNAGAATAENTLVKNVTFRDMGRVGVVAFDGAHGLTVRDCNVYGWMRRRDLTDGAIDTYGFNIEDVTIENNYIDTTTTGAAGTGRHTAIRIQEAENVTVTENTARMRSPDTFLGWQVGKRDSATNPNSKDVTIRDNSWIFDAEPDRGARIDGCDSLTVENNDWEINTTNGIFILIEARVGTNGEVSISDETAGPWSDGRFVGVDSASSIESLKVVNCDVSADRELVVTAGPVERLLVSECDFKQSTTGPGEDAVVSLGNVSFARVVNNYLETSTGGYLSGTPSNNLVDSGNQNPIA